MPKTTLLSTAVGFTAGEGSPGGGGGGHSGSRGVDWRFRDKAIGVFYTKFNEDFVL